MAGDDRRRWFHCILTTYGAWLPGDPRGFRTRHHREHVEGDYKRPPPEGVYDERLARSRKLQKHPEVQLATAERKLLGVECVRQFQLREIEAIALAVAGQHVHLQFKCDSNLVIATLGELKRAMWYARSQAGDGSRLWGRGRKIVPIESREHQERVFGYILDHRKEGAWAWCYRDGFDLN
jgi:hypothetical protein